VNVIFDNWVIRLVGKVSKYDLKKIFENNETAILLGDDTYWTEAFLLCVKSFTNDVEFLVAVCSDIVLEPSIISHKKNDLLIIGFNNDIVAIDLNIAKVASSKQLGSPFYFAKFIENRIIVITEIGVFALTDELKEIFYQPTNLVESFRFMENELIIITESEARTIDIFYTPTTTPDA